jgi:uncharacterized PurR-regulated membrane protein YhhQ (DUF165 family)
VVSVKKKINNSYILLLTFLLLITSVFCGKQLYIAPRLIINSSMIIYPITFIVSIIIYEKYKMKEAKNAIITSILMILLFYLIGSILCSFNSTLDSKIISDSLRRIITPNYFSLYNMIIYYPNLINLLTLCGCFYLSHYIMLVVYEVSKDYVNYIVAFIVSLLIAFFIDQMLYTSVTNLSLLVSNKISLVNYIELLTANYIVVVISTIIMTFILPLILKREKN